jgi:hypothetical protein
MSARAKTVADLVTTCKEQGVDPAFVSLFLDAAAAPRPVVAADPSYIHQDGALSLGLVLGAEED